MPRCIDGIHMGTSKILLLTVSRVLIGLSHLLGLFMTTAALYVELSKRLEPGVSTQLRNFPGQDTRQRCLLYHCARLNHPSRHRMVHHHPPHHHPPQQHTHTHTHRLAPPHTPQLTYHRVANTKANLKAYQKARVNATQIPPTRRAARDDSVSV